MGKVKLARDKAREERRAKAIAMRAADKPLSEIAKALKSTVPTISRDLKDLPKKRVVVDGYVRCPRCRKLRQAAREKAKARNKPKA
jgi:DNA invertase Pin-like site-specific DNA recombinase